MEIVIRRKYFKPTYTIGYWLVNGVQKWNSLEDKDRGLHQSMPTTEVYKKKTYGSTAIPKGKYRVVLSYSPKFASREWGKKYGGLVPEIQNVPCFSGVRIHPGSDCNSTSGCPLVGWNTARGKLTNSVKCYYEFMDEYLVPAHNNKEEIWITIE